MRSPRTAETSVSMANGGVDGRASSSNLPTLIFLGVWCETQNHVFGVPDDMALLKIKFL
jgi:hypothetical protein